MRKTEALLYEYEHKRIPFAGMDHVQLRDAFDRLETSLQGIWSKKDYYGEQRGMAQSTQQFLRLNYRDYSVQAQQYVGIVQTDAVRLTLLPKIFRGAGTQSDAERTDHASRDLLYLLTYAERLRPPRSDGGPLRERKRQDFFELFVYLFASHAWQTLEREVYRAYHTAEEDLSVVKGSINFSEHLKRNVSTARLHKISCRYDLFQDDNTFNRVLKHVSRCLLRITKNDENKRLLRNILATLVDVTDVRCCYEDTLRIVFNATQREWIPILHSCRLFLRHSLITLQSNNVQVFCFLLDMNALFEGFVAGFLKQHLREWTVDVQKSNLSVARSEDGSDVFQMQHDLFLTRGERTIIIDTKYKPTNFTERDAGISQADVYQLATYAVRRGVKDVILLYPRYVGDTGPAHRTFSIDEAFSGQKIRLHCWKIDLTGLPETRQGKDEIVKKQLEGMLEG